jgi:arsenite transporter
VPETLARFTYAQVSIPVAILIWLMIYPMMVQIDFASILGVRRQPKGLTITLVVNWLIKPFTMFVFAWLFLQVLFAPLIEAGLAREYVAGAILLGAAPCTAMVFVWSYLTRGDPAYTLVQVAINDLIMLFAFAPIVISCWGIGDIAVPYDTVLLSVVLYIVIPLVAGYLSRVWLIRPAGRGVVRRRLPEGAGAGHHGGAAAHAGAALLLPGREVILNNPLHIALIAVPLIVQTVFIFAIAYGWAKAWRVQHNVAAPAALIGASNFFELAVAAAIVLFGLNSGAALATVVGVLVEVPLMLMLVRFANATRDHFPAAPGPSRPRAAAGLSEPRDEPGGDARPPVEIRIEPPRGRSSWGTAAR